MLSKYPFNLFFQRLQTRKYCSRVLYINYYDKICVKHGHRLFISTCLLYCPFMYLGQDDPANHLPAKIHRVITWHVQLTNHSLNTTQLYLKTTIEMTIDLKHVIYCWWTKCRIAILVLNSMHFFTCKMWFLIDS